jgi:UrcA family protein
MKASRSVPVALVSLVLGAAAASAEPVQDLQKISVEANAVVITHGKYSPTGIEETVSLSRTVQYGDLNLATPAGVHALASRISVTATEVCAELGKRYPDASAGAEQADRNQCINQAVDKAMKQVNLIVAAAKR